MARLESLESYMEEFLEKCRGENPPPCTAACPLHVDARGYVALVKEGKYKEALELVREVLPFPAIMGEICTRPCERGCKRMEMDRPISVCALKKFIVERGKGSESDTSIAEERAENIAVIGAGPCGLMAGFDLRKKGYQVTIFEAKDHAGGQLVDGFPSYRLSRDLVNQEISIVEKLGVKYRFNTKAGKDTNLRELQDQYQAAVIAVGPDAARALAATNGDLRFMRRGTVRVNPITLETSVKGIFAAGDSVTGPNDVIHALASGRKAATSIDRFVRGEDLFAGREGEGILEANTVLEIDPVAKREREPAPNILEPRRDALSEEDAKAEAERCLYCECGICVKNCEFLSKYCDTPKELIRKFKEGLDLEKLVVAYSCNLCEKCAQVCPENLDTGAICLELRRQRVETEGAPLPQHKPMQRYESIGVSKYFSLVRGDPDTEACNQVFFPGCNLPAYSPDLVEKAWQYLRERLPGTGIMLYCCGGPSHMMGMEARFEEITQQIEDYVLELGAGEVIVACPDCYHTLKSSLTKVAVNSIYHVLTKYGVPEESKTDLPATFDIHDSCPARHYSDLHDSARNIIEQVGHNVHELESSRGASRCCGFGGMIHAVDGELSSKVAERRLSESEFDMVAYCAGCRARFASLGKPTLHMLDLAFNPNWKEQKGMPPTSSLSNYWKRWRLKCRLKKL